MVNSHAQSNSLQKMGIDFLDIYLLHRDEPSRPVSEIVDMMDGLQQACYRAHCSAHHTLPLLPFISVVLNVKHRFISRRF